MHRLHSKSFLRGCARILDMRGAISPTYRYDRYRTIRRNRPAFAADWAAIWSDLGTAFSRVVERGTAPGAHG